MHWILTIPNMSRKYGNSDETLIMPIDIEAMKGCETEKIFPPWESSQLILDTEIGYYYHPTKVIPWSNRTSSSPKIQECANGKDAESASSQ